MYGIACPKCQTMVMYPGYTDGRLNICQCCGRPVSLNSKLSPEQVENWRKVLCGMIGPAAFILPAEEIQALKDKMQGNVDKMEVPNA
jgi:hypothetical protein